MTAVEPRPMREDYPRNRYGQVCLPTGEVLYSPSNLDNYLGGGFSNPPWQARHQAIGAGKRPDLAAMAVPLDVSVDKHELDWIVNELELAGGRGSKANLGTAVHSAVRRLWVGEWPEVPPGAEADIESINEAMEEWQLELVPGWDERFLVNFDLPSGGSADGIVTCGPEDGNIIADVKTGQFKPLACAIQMSAYANSTHHWEPDMPEPQPLPFQIRNDIGLVIHAPYGQGKCRIIAVDLIEGYRLAKLAVAAHKETLDSGRVVIK